MLIFKKVCVRQYKWNVSQQQEMFIIGIVCIMQFYIHFIFRCSFISDDSQLLL